MNEREALLRAVCDNPDDDTPRLVFADWLQENGEEARGDFIRLEIQLARGNYRPSEEARIKRRVRKLLTTHGSRWQQEIGGYGRAIFRRGFLTHTALHIDDLERALISAPFQLIELEGEVRLLDVLQFSGIRQLAYLDLSKATLRYADLEEFAERNWPTHPWKLMLPRQLESGTRSLISARFGNWVFFGQWY